MYKVGRVSDEEKKELVILYERKMAMEELEESLERTDLTESEFLQMKSKFKEEKPKTIYDFNKWWQDKAEKYKWDKKDHGQWTIDFETNDIFLL